MMNPPTHTLVLLAPESDFDQLDVVRAWLEARGLAIVDQRVLPAPRALADQRTSLALGLAGAVAPEALRASLDALSEEIGADLILQSRDVRQADYRLAVFDMDSTLITCEVIDELASRHGVGDAVADITERAMRGEIDFNQSFAERLGMLKGLSTDVIADIAEHLPLSEGVKQLIPTLRARGIHTAILSGGFVPFAARLQELLGFDEIHANELEDDGAALTGRVVEPVVNGARKAELLEQIRASRGLRADQVIAVGDGANDLPMLAKAGLGVAFRAKPIVRAQASYNIRHVGLDGVACLLGAGSEVAGRTD